MITASSAFALACLMLLVGALSPLILVQHRRAAAYVGHYIAAFAMIPAAAAGWMCLTGPEMDLFLFSTPLFGDVGVRIDDLSAFFVLLIAFVTVAVSIYAPRYVLSYAGSRNYVALTALYDLFILSMLLVVTMDNAFGFILAWEFMSLISYFFVAFNHKKEENVRAGFLYLVMTHISTAFIMVAFLLLGSQAGGITFAEMSAGAADFTGEFKSMIFALILVGFGIKAGVIPLHLWLPEAHPAAPSHISALMSGVMIKTAIYGIIRVLFDILGADNFWWGIILLAVGAVSAVLGVMYALMEHDLKRLLAFHSVENIGIILLGVGAAAIYMPSGMIAPALLALVAGLLHTMNHAIFKTLLFLGAGSIIYSAGTRDIEKLGGLAKAMPYTAALFFIGSAAISALPPLNGFLSEWLTLQALLAGTAAPDMISRLAVPAAAAALAITGGFAATCFVKAYGITFLGRRRDTAAAQPREVPASMIGAMGLLAAACIAIGLVPGIGIGLTGGVAKETLSQALVMNNDQSATGSEKLKAGDSSSREGALLFSSAPIKVDYLSLSLRPVGTQPSQQARGANNATTTISPLLIAGLISFLFVVIYIFARSRGRKFTKDPKERLMTPWACGLPALAPKMQYSAGAFTKPLRVIFSGIYRPQREVRINCSDPEEPYVIQGIHYHSSFSPVYEIFLYRPVSKALIFAGNLFGRLETGSIHIYLSYIFVTLIFILVVSVWK